MMSELKEERIRKLARNDRIAFKKHTALWVRQRGISSDEVKEALRNCIRAQYFRVGRRI